MIATALLLVVVISAAPAGGWTSAAYKLSRLGAATTSSPRARITAPGPAASAGSDDVLRQALAIAAPAKPPVRLAIPAIGVDAAVEQVGLDSQGRMAAPARTDDVGWYNLGTVPGDAGDAVIDGHLDWYTGPAVFQKLGRLKTGDQITVLHDDGTTVKFIVDATTVTPYDASTDALFTRSGPPSLTLITCAGTWDRQRGTYLQRLVVHSALAPSTALEKPTGGGG